MLRQSYLSHLQLDIIGIAESHLIKRGVLEMDDYKWFGQNRQTLHVNAKKRSGGVGCFIKNEIFNDFDVTVLGSSYEGFLWLSLKSKAAQSIFYICVCYLPPMNSPRQVDAQHFTTIF